MIGQKHLIVLLFLCLIECFGNDDGKLKAVVVLFRHGDRSPIGSWPNDIYFNDTSLWPDGYGQLNNFGKERHYVLGQWFRDRYKEFLPSRYNYKDIFIRSTNVDRTLMSAASNLAGLYPPEDDQVWNQNISWQAIPVHTVPEPDDPILATSISCPKHDSLVKELLNSTEFQELNAKYAKVYSNISEVTGYPLNEVSLKTFSSMYSAITIYREFNFSLPDWTNYYWPDIKFLSAKEFQIYTYTTDLARLRSGPFFNYLNEFLKSTKFNKPFSAQNLNYLPKFLMLSAHDTTVGDFSNSMGVFNDIPPEFASTVIWEVKSRNGSDDDLYLNLYFKNSTHFTPLKVNGCEVDCNLDDFSEIMAPVAVTVDEFKKECQEKFF